jgi:DNA-binding NarL/FixJ family response regulator/RNA polymerase-binding transcription factor DksA
VRSRSPVRRSEPDLAVGAEAPDGKEAVDLARSVDIDLAILDVAMPRMTGLQAARELSAGRPELRILMLTMYDNEQYFFQALKAGAAGYVLKSVADRDLVEACRAAMRGEPFLSPGAVQALIRNYLNRVRDGQDIPEQVLTAREEEVLKLVAEGHSSKAIADLLCISLKTDERHRANMLQKLGLRDRLELTRYAIRVGLIEPRAAQASVEPCPAGARARPSPPTQPHSIRGCRGSATRAFGLRRARPYWIGPFAAMVALCRPEVAPAAERSATVRRSSMNHLNQLAPPSGQHRPRSIDLGWFRRELEQQRRFRLDQLTDLSYQAARTSDDAHGEVARALMAGARVALSDIDAALFRLAIGSFGVCQRCGRPIPVEQLEVIPMTCLCLPCQYEQETHRPKQDIVDVWGADSFPASDPPANW